MTPTPELALTIALIALFGVLVNALVTAYNARKRGSIDERLLKLKAEIDHVNAREIARVQADHAEKQKIREFERTQDLAGDERKRKADAERFASILELLDSKNIMVFLREHDFGGAFPRNEIEPLNVFVNLSGDPDQTFLFDELEQQRLQVVQKARTLSKLIGVDTHPRQGDLISVLPEDYVNRIRPEWIEENATKLNNAATEFVSAFDEMVLTCRKKLAV
jgi:hypothetical protein